MSRAKILDDLNKLIDFYEQHKPNNGKEIQVDLSPKSLALLIGHIFEKDKMGDPIVVKRIPYRGRTLIAVGKG